MVSALWALEDFERATGEPGARRIAPAVLPTPSRSGERLERTAMHSCLYTGTIRHRRFAPRRNEFRYRIFLTLLDLAELPTGCSTPLVLVGAPSRPRAWFRAATTSAIPACRSMPPCATSSSARPGRAPPARSGC